MSDLKSQLFTNSATQLRKRTTLESVKGVNLDHDIECDKYTNFLKATNCEMKNKHPEVKDHPRSQEGVNCEEMVKMPDNQSEHQSREGENANQSVMDKYIKEALERCGESSLENAIDPVTMDVRTVIQMVSEMKAELKAEIMAEIESETDVNPPKSNEDRMKTATMQAKIDVNEAKHRMVADTLAGMTDKIDTIIDRLDLMDISENKRTIILSGFETNQKKYNARRQLTEFFDDKVGVEVQIEEFYYIGRQKPRDIVVQFLSIQTKREVLRACSQIKHLRNKYGKKYSIRDFQTPKQLAVTRKGQQIADLIAGEDPIDQEEVTIHKGNIFVGSEKYQQQVQAPAATDVLRYPMYKLNQIMAMNVQRGTTHEECGNRFIPYIADVQDCATINDIYMKLRLQHAEARHIVCAWNIDGTTKRYELSDSCDDNDHGASKPILDMIRVNNINNCAVFVVRKCGEKLNEKRIGNYIKAVKRVVKEYPENSVTKQKRAITEENAPSSSENNSYAAKVQGRNKPKGVVKRWKGPKQTTEKRKITGAFRNPCQQTRKQLTLRRTFQPHTQKMRWKLRTNDEINWMHKLIDM